MSARIRHLALYTENQNGIGEFLQNRVRHEAITERFNQPNHGHISNGVIGLAVLRRRLGFHSALDHFGFEFYHEVFDLKEGKKFYDEDALSVTDGTVDLVIRRTSNHSYMSMREGIDHFGYAVESIEEVKKDLDEFGRANPGAAPKELAGGVFGHITQEDIDSCKVGEYADPDGLLLNLSTRTA